MSRWRTVLVGGVALLTAIVLAVDAVVSIASGTVPESGQRRVARASRAIPHDGVFYRPLWNGASTEARATFRCCSSLTAGLMRTGRQRSAGRRRRSAWPASSQWRGRRRFCLKRLGAPPLVLLADARWRSRPTSCIRRRSPSDANRSLRRSRSSASRRSLPLERAGDFEQTCAAGGSPLRWRVHDEGHVRVRAGCRDCSRCFLAGRRGAAVKLAAATVVGAILVSRSHQPRQRRPRHRVVPCVRARGIVALVVAQRRRPSRARSQLIGTSHLLTVVFLLAAAGARAVADGPGCNCRRSISWPPEPSPPSFSPVRERS